jgi:putative Mn2+ efflux pump MntP
MIREAFDAQAEEHETLEGMCEVAVSNHGTVCEDPLPLGRLLVLAVATSIDALAVGISFAFLRVSIIWSAAVIGLITFAICTAGVYIGNRFGGLMKKKAEIVGGLILICIGLKILFEHIGIIG